VITSSLTGLLPTAAARPYVRNVFIHSRRRCLQQRKGLCSGCTAPTAEGNFLLLGKKFRSSAFLPEFFCSKIQSACVNNPASFVGNKMRSSRRRIFYYNLSDLTPECLKTMFARAFISNLYFKEMKICSCYLLWLLPDTSEKFLIFLTCKQKQIALTF
jgi:hypothetical protein